MPKPKTKKKVYWAVTFRGRIEDDNGRLAIYDEARLARFSATAFSWMEGGSPLRVIPVHITPLTKSTPRKK